MSKRAVIGITALSLLVTSCAQYAKESDLDCIKIGMKKEKAMDGMSSRGYMRGSLLNKYGDVIEVREYEVQRDKDAGFYIAAGILTICTFGILLPIFLAPGHVDTYWLYFSNNKLIQWGKAGDWKEAERIIWDININKV
jgi:hypothetical protein